LLTQFEAASKLSPNLDRTITVRFKRDVQLTMLLCVAGLIGLWLGRCLCRQHSFKALGSEI